MPNLLSRFARYRWFPLPIGRVVRREASTYNRDHIEPTVVRLIDSKWRFTWPVVASSYEIFLNGFLISTVTTELFEYEGHDFEAFPPPCEILAAGSDSLNTRFPPYIWIQWRGLQAAGGYAVEQFLSGSFTEIGQIMEQGTGYYRWREEDLDDNATHLFRVFAIAPEGQEGAPATFSIDMARNPKDPTPDVAFSIASGGDIVVSAA